MRRKRRAPRRSSRHCRCSNILQHRRTGAPRCAISVVSCCFLNYWTLRRFLKRNFRAGRSLGRHYPTRGAAAVARKYGKTSGRKVKKAVHEMKRGKLKSGRSGAKVKSRKQAIAIGLSQARQSGAKVPRKKSGGSKKKSSRKKK